MKDEEKTEGQLIKELAAMRQRIAELAEAEAERKRAEEALRDSEERFRQFFEKEPEYCYMISPEGIILDVNNAALRALGYKKEELVGKALKTVYAPESLPRMKQLFAKWKKAGEVKDEEIVIITKEGDRRTVLLSAGVVRDKNGKVLHSVSVQKDITERKLAEEALRESEEKYRTLFEGVPVGLYRTTPDGQIRDANLALVEMLGYPDQESLLAINVTDGYVDPEERRRWQARMDREGVVRDFEARWRRRDGTVIWVEESARVARDDGGRVLYYEGAVEDITDRKRAEEEYGTILRTAMDGFWLANVQGRFLDVNDAYCRLIGCSRDELLTMGIQDVEALETPEEIARHIQRIMETGSDRFETRHRCKDGRVVDVEVSVNHLQGDEGRLFVFLRDITRRKRAERLLQALNQAALAMEQALTPEEIFAAVAEEFKKLGLSCMVFPTDESQSKLFPKHLSYESGALKAAEKLVGIQHEDFSIPVESVDVYRKVVWERKTVFVGNAEEIMRQVLPKPINRFVGQIVRMLKVLKSIPAPLMVGDKVIGVLSVQSDDLTEEDIPAITAFAHQMAAAWRKAQLLEDLQNSLKELKQTQAQLLQAQKMEAVGRLAGGIAHDFNNLLTVITGFSEILLHRCLDDSDPLYQPIEEIKKAGDRAASLTGQLLAFSRKQMLQPRVLDLNAVVADMDKMLRRIIGEDIDLVTVLDPELGPVKADPGQIEQVIVNLAVNARDAIPQGGQLTLETADVELDEDYARQHIGVEPGPYVMLAVSDTGVGMDKETQSHLFEPFFTTKEEGTGTGLGLATVYGIVKQSGGHIWVYSELGQGTTFKVYLPRVTEAIEPLKSSAAPTGPLQGSETVLMVEDDEAVRMLAREVLEMDGYTVLEARHGGEALLICEQHEGPIHLMVTDVVMPQMSGRELAERLAPLHPEMKVLYISGYADKAIVRHGVLDAGLALLQKPFTPDALAHKVRQVLDAPQ